MNQIIIIHVLRFAPKYNILKKQKDAVKEDSGALCYNIINLHFWFWIEICTMNCASPFFLGQLEYFIAKSSFWAFLKIPILFWILILIAAGSFKIQRIENEEIEIMRHYLSEELLKIYNHFFKKHLKSKHEYHVRKVCVHSNRVRAQVFSYLPRNEEDRQRWDDRQDQDWRKHVSSPFPSKNCGWVSRSTNFYI